MNDTILLGRGERILEIAQSEWMKHLDLVPQHGRQRLAFMSEAHHRIRYFVVRELPKRGHALSPAVIARETGIPAGRTAQILDELERGLFFLVRNRDGHVSWAFPVTVDPTPHEARFHTGETIFAAWAEDALATPFVQGRLRNEVLRVRIDTACAHCGQAMRIHLDSEMRYEVEGSDETPLIFEPDVDWHSFKGSNILDAYWKNSLFFWSEEHAREYRSSANQVDGTYLTLEQGAYSIPITQGTLFAFAP